MADARRRCSRWTRWVRWYPLVYNLREIDGFANNIASLPFSAPYNQFGYARELLGPETEFVSPNKDAALELARLVRPDLAPPVCGQPRRYPPRRPTV